MKRKYSGPYPSPPKRSRQVAKAGFSAAKRTAIGKRLAKYAARGVGRLVPGISTAMAAYDMYKSLRGNTVKAKKIGGRDYRIGKRIKRNKVQKLTVFDKAANRGVVERQQYGNVKTASGNYKVLYLAHSTMPAQRVGVGMFAALIKKLLSEASLHIKDWSSPIVDDQYYNGIIELRYRVEDGAAITAQNFTLTSSSSTLLSLANAMATFFEGLTSNNLPSELLTLRYYVDFSGVVATSKVLHADIDLTSVSFLINSKSEMRVQNRTINSTGNDEADDVDNVPLDGKFFEYATNGTQYRDYTGATTSSALTTDHVYGVLSTITPSTTSTRLFSDIPLRSQIVGCKNIGSYNLQPGSIRSSVMYDKVYISFSKLVHTLYTKTLGGGGVGQYHQVWLGKTRLLAFEKTIHPTTTGAVNQINVAYDHKVELGITCYSKKKLQTAPHIRNLVQVAVN